MYIVLAKNSSVQAVVVSFVPAVVCVCTGLCIGLLHYTLLTRWCGVCLWYSGLCTQHYWDNIGCPEQRTVLFREWVTVHIIGAGSVLIRGVSSTLGKEVPLYVCAESHCTCLCCLWLAVVHLHVSVDSLFVVGPEHGATPTILMFISGLITSWHNTLKDLFCK